MSDIPYTPPKMGATVFNCAYCSAYANQRFVAVTDGRAGTNYKISCCTQCGKWAAWHQNEMIYPPQTTAPHPNNDLPDDIKRDYLEAQSIVAKSPRGAAALLRLCIQKLCSHLGEDGENLNANIASLVKKGLSPKVQQSLDTVRFVGNESVHPGTLDLNDDSNTADKLFDLVNVIASAMISHPKEVEQIYITVVPEEKRKEIEKRDESKE